MSDKKLSKYAISRIAEYEAEIEIYEMMIEDWQHDQEFVSQLEWSINQYKIKIDKLKHTTRDKL
jgi:flagellar biosynthesis chaperone FliJ